MTESQLVLDLAHQESWDEANFLVTSRNERAFGLVAAWPHWQAPAAVIYGPPQSGKTYLANIWGVRAGATFLDAREISAHVWLQPYKPLILENADTTAFDETALFHHLNLAREHQSSILFTARKPPGQWVLELPDLRSRVRSYPTAEIQPPDEEHLAALLVKHFSDRQISVAPDVIAYLVARMERSMAAAHRLAAHIDKIALSEHRRVTRALAARVFTTLNRGGIGLEEGSEADPGA